MATIASPSIPRGPSSLGKTVGLPGVLCVTFVAGILIQRLGLWVGGFPFAASIALVVFVPALLWLKAGAVVLPGRLVAYVCLALTATVSGIVNIATFKPTSYFLFLLLYLPFCFSVPASKAEYGKTQRGYATVAMAFGVLGLFQYAIQFFIALPYRLFSWSWFVPSQFLIEYNSLNRLGYLSSTFKSNGVFFLEASAVSQLLARTFLIGRAYRVDWWVSGLTLLGIAVTYSGSGMVLIAIFIFPLILLEAAQRPDGGLKRLLPYGVAAAAAVLVAGALTVSGKFHIEAITGRLGEVSQPGSSGWARYGSSFILIRDALHGHGALGVLFGVGSGRSSTADYRFETFETAWVKLLIEYGVMGLAAFVSFLGICLWSSSRSVFVSGVLMFSFLFLDANVLVPQYVFFLVMLGALPTLRKTAEGSG